MRWLRLGIVWSALTIGAFAAEPVDINAADAQRLEALPGIGPSKASAIIAFREEYGPFKTIEDLDAVPGIGSATLTVLSPLITVSASPTPEASVDDTDEPVSGPVPAPVLTINGALERVDINTADVRGLEELPGIGPAKAEAIIGYRNTFGPFTDCQDLIAVDGIGPATISTVREHCTTGPSSDTLPSP
ncbi:MAG: ComEA family DNA-binding protein [Myxococcota bacterium]